MADPPNRFLFHDFLDEARAGSVGGDGRLDGGSAIAEEYRQCPVP